MAHSGDDLVERFRDGQPDAVRSVARIARSVISHRGYYVARDERDDLVQETVVQVYQAVVDADFQLSVGIEPLTRTVAHRRCVDWLRRHRVMATADAFSPAPSRSPEFQVLRSEMLHRARAAIARLGFSYRQILRLRIMEGLSYREIAERLGSTEASVRVRMHKCARKIHDMIEEEDRDERTRARSRRDRHGA